MNTTRRVFFGSMLAAGATALAGELPGFHPGAEFHFSCQMSQVPGRDFNEKFDLLEKLGYDRVELNGGGLDWLRQNEASLLKAMHGRKLQFCCACTGARGNAGQKDPAVRRETIDTTKKILEVVGHLDAKTMIICPARSNIELPFPELRDRFLNEFLPEILEAAKQANICIVLEPLRRNETMFLRQVADGAAIARDAHHPNLGVMGDFWHMTLEETSDFGAFVCAGSLLRHVHIASRRTRRIPGCDGETDNYIDGLKGLRHIGYRGAISIEAGYPKGADKIACLTRAIQLVSRQWEAP